MTQSSRPIWVCPTLYLEWTQGISESFHNFCITFSIIIDIYQHKEIRFGKCIIDKVIINRLGTAIYFPIFIVKMNNCFHICPLNDRSFPKSYKQRGMYTAPLLYADCQSKAFPLKYAHRSPRLGISRHTAGENIALSRFFVASFSCPMCA